MRVMTKTDGMRRALQVLSVAPWCCRCAGLRPGPGRSQSGGAYVHGSTSTFRQSTSFAASFRRAIRASRCSRQRTWFASAHALISVESSAPGTASRPALRVRMGPQGKLHYEEDFYATLSAGALAGFDGR